MNPTYEQEKVLVLSTGDMNPTYEQGKVLVFTQDINETQLMV